MLHHMTVRTLNVVSVRLSAFLLSPFGRLFISPHTKPPPPPALQIAAWFSAGDASIHFLSSSLAGADALLRPQYQKPTRLTGEDRDRRWEMIVPQQPDAQIEGLTESASSGAENCLGIIELTKGFMPGCGKNSFHGHWSQYTDIHVEDLQRTSYPTQEATQSSSSDSGPLELPALSSLQGTNNSRKQLNERQAYLTKIFSFQNMGFSMRHVIRLCRFGIDIGSWMEFTIPTPTRTW